jgi:hypothetical protein
MFISSAIESGRFYEVKVHRVNRNTVCPNLQDRQARYRIGNSRMAA